MVLKSCPWLWPYVTALERLQREMLRKLQSLTRSTATVAVTCLLGIRPLENELDLRRLTLLCNVLFTDGTLEQDVALRQIAVKDADSHIWFTACNRLLHKYNLPNIYVLKEQFSSEDKCKAAIKWFDAGRQDSCYQSTSVNRNLLPAEG